MESRRGSRAERANFERIAAATRALLEDAPPRSLEVSAPSVGVSPERLTNGRIQRSEREAHGGDRGLCETAGGAGAGSYSQR